MTGTITIPELPGVAGAEATDIIPGSRGGLAKRITVRQILDLIARADLAGKLFSEDMVFVPGAGPLLSEDVQAAIDELAAASLGIKDADVARALLGIVDGSDRLRAILAAPGQVVQEVYVERSVSDTTTSATFADTGLTAAITPLFADSIIVAEAIIPSAQIQRVAGTLINRFGQIRIRNNTQDIDGPAATVGRNLAASSDVSAISYSPVAVRYRGSVASLAALTFVLQFRAGTETNLQVTTGAANSVISLSLKEIRQ